MLFHMSMRLKNSNVAFFFESFRIGVSDGAFQSVNLYTISLSKGVYFVGCIWIKQLSQPVQLVLITATASQTAFMVVARPYVCWVLLFLWMFHCLSVSTILATFFNIKLAGFKTSFNNNNKKSFYFLATQRNGSF